MVNWYDRSTNSNIGRKSNIEKKNVAIFSCPFAVLPRNVVLIRIMIRLFSRNHPEGSQSMDRKEMQNQKEKKKNIWQTVGGLVQKKFFF